MSVNVTLNKIVVNYFSLFNKVLKYQPTYMKNKFLLLRNKIVRGGDDRYSDIVNHIDIQNGSYLDIGSQIGYFVFKMAEKGFFSVGIEFDKKAYQYALSLKVVNNVMNAGFSNIKIDEKNVTSLPSFDVVSILNVFHHLVYFNGFENADFIIRELVSKTNDTFIFETGEHEEKGEYWTDCLSFMGEDSSIWIKNYLQSLGFSSVVIIGGYSNHLNDHKRTLYCCKK